MEFTTLPTSENLEPEYATPTYSVPAYTAKVLKHDKELLFDFSHLEDLPSVQATGFAAEKNKHFESLVNDWIGKYENIARKCSSFVIRLPNGELKNYSPQPKAQIKKH